MKNKDNYIKQKASSKCMKKEDESIETLGLKYITLGIIFLIFITLCSMIIYGV